MLLEDKVAVIYGAGGAIGGAAEGVQLNVPVRDSSVSCASFNQFSAIFSQRS
jgi:hypothetical protein